MKCFIFLFYPNLDTFSKNCLVISKALKNKGNRHRDTQRLEKTQLLTDTQTDTDGYTESQ
jgi:hypothetical protein